MGYAETRHITHTLIPDQRGRVTAPARKQIIRTELAEAALNHEPNTFFTELWSGIWVCV